MLLLHHLYYAVLSLCAVSAVITTQLITTTNVAGATVTLSSIYDPATTTLPAGLIRTVLTTTNDLGITVTLTQTVPTAAAAATTTTGTATSSVSSISSSSSSSSLSSASSSSTLSTTSAKNAAADPGNTRPDPSTAFTGLPLSAVTTLPIDSFVTITEGTTRTYTTTRGATSNLWVTITTQGQTTVIQTTFAQRFSSQYSEIASPSSGSVGLGTISGTVGQVKSVIQKTFSNSNAAVPLLSYSPSSITGAVLALVMWIL